MTVPSEIREALLDTDTLSLSRRAHAQVTRHAAAYIHRYGQLTLTELTRYEVLRGLTAARARRQLAAFESFCRLHRILPFDAEAARRSADIWADLRARGQPIGEVDTMIAGIALGRPGSRITQYPSFWPCYGARRVGLDNVTAMNIIELFPNKFIVRCKAFFGQKQRYYMQN